MNEKEIRALANKIAKNIKTEDDLNDFSRILKKITVTILVTTSTRYLTKLTAVMATPAKR
ncbi:hypothetical protein BOW49_00825 [Solemya velum gill symbiont]|nr:hypothetical protein BOW49_00825 [Solemya velum gill symbiont]